MVVYKFKAISTAKQRKHVFDIIDNERCYLAKWQDLNDPLEGFFRYYENIFGEAISAHKERYKVCSFSRYYSNSLLWSYYAEGFTGLCIAMEIEDRFLDPILYQSDIPEFEDFGHNSTSKNAKIALKTKLNYWRHESEIRAIVPSEELEEGNYLKCKVVAVLFGEKVDPKIKQQIENKSASRFETDTVQIQSGMTPHDCDGVTTGVRLKNPENLPIKEWRHVGIGPLSGWSHPSRQCQVCGISDPQVLELHYITPLSEGGIPSPKNSACLCANCHKREHYFDENRNRLHEANLSNRG